MTVPSATRGDHDGRARGGGGGEDGGVVVLGERDVRRQSLAIGDIGPALLAVEHAHHDPDSWAAAHRLITHVAAGPVDAAPHTGLYQGAPAVLFLLHTTTADGHDRYPAARHTLEQHVRRLVRRRLDAAADRIRRGRASTFTEHDLFHGLTGLAALLLHVQPGCDELGDTLRHLARLTKPVVRDGDVLPGWWVDHHPDPALPTPGGHANLGMAHGAAGLLAVLALAARHGHHVDGQLDTIGRLVEWFDQWQQDGVDGPWWPQWLTRTELRTGQPEHTHPGRPSWCYGTPGIARALHLAAIATGDTTRQNAAETAFTACLTDQQLDRLTDPGICHGLAGLHRTAHRIAADALTPEPILTRLASITERLAHTPDPADCGFLTGRAGTALARHAAHRTAPASGWDACLLIT